MQIGDPDTDQSTYGPLGEILHMGLVGDAESKGAAR